MHKNKITILEWDEQQFKDSKETWTELLQRSSSDQLFLSWEWLYSWWSVFSVASSMQLKLFVAIDANNKLIGIAPLYITQLTTKKIFPTRRLQFIGGCWRGEATMRTELLEFVADKDRTQDIIRAFYQHIHNDKDWNEFVLADLVAQSETYQILEQQKPLGKAYYRLAENYNSYYLPLTDDFESYLKQLGKK